MPFSIMGGASNFSDLIDNNINYATDQNKLLKVNNAGTGLTATNANFYDNDQINSLESITWAPRASAGLNNYNIFVDSADNDLKFINASSAVVSLTQTSGVQGSQGPPAINGPQGFQGNQGDAVTTGTWSPSLSSGANSFTMTTQDGVYKTIGGITFCDIRIAWSAKGADGGWVSIDNLPTGSNNGYYLLGSNFYSVSGLNADTDGTGWRGLTLTKVGTAISISKFKPSTVTQCAYADFSNSGSIYVSFMYA